MRAVRNGPASYARYLAAALPPPPADDHPLTTRHAPPTACHPRRPPQGRGSAESEHEQMD